MVRWRQEPRRRPGLALECAGEVGTRESAAFPDGAPRRGAPALDAGAFPWVVSSDAGRRLALVGMDRASGGLR